VDLTAAVSRYLAWRAGNDERAYRDDNCWRIVPIRIASPGALTVRLTRPRMVVQ
jgi:hypothetical protein